MKKFIWDALNVLSHWLTIAGLSAISGIGHLLRGEYTAAVPWLLVTSVCLTAEMQRRRMIAEYDDE